MIRNHLYPDYNLEKYIEMHLSGIHITWCVADVYNRPDTPTITYVGYNKCITHHTPTITYAGL